VFKIGSNPDFLTTESTEDTEKRNLQPVLNWDYLEALKYDLGYPMSSSS